jgi:hypothetical protein
MELVVQENSSRKSWPNQSDNHNNLPTANCKKNETAGDFVAFDNGTSAQRVSTSDEYRAFKKKWFEICR